MAGHEAHLLHDLLAGDQDVHLVKQGHGALIDEHRSCLLYTSLLRCGYPALLPELRTEVTDRHDRAKRPFREKDSSRKGRFLSFERSAGVHELGINAFHPGVVKVLVPIHGHRAVGGFALDAGGVARCV